MPNSTIFNSAEDQEISECYRNVVNSYNDKPIEFDVIIESVQKLGIYWQLVNQLSNTSTGS